MSVPTAVVSKEDWHAQREALLVKEKELTRARDALAAERRRLPMVRVDSLEPGTEIAEYPEGCPGCTMFADNLPNLTHLEARDTTMVFVSAGPQQAFEDYRERMGWGDWPWYTSTDDFSADFGVDQWFGINVFLRDGDEIYRSYYTTSRAAEDLSSVWGLLDITPFGRREEWQDAPDGVPQGPTGSWMRRNDAYTPEELAGSG